MKGKSLLVNLLVGAIAILGALSGVFSPAVAGWIGIFTFATTLVLSTVFPSGTLPTGWTAVSWVVNIGGILIQVANYLSNNKYLPSSDVNYIIIAINAVIQLFLKDYGNGSSLSAPAKS